MIRVLRILIWFLVIPLFAQQIPNTFQLNKILLSKLSDSTPKSNTIEYIEINKDTIWVGTGGGLSKSTDFGETWQTIEFGDEGISALAINNDTVWVATWHPFEDAFGEILPVGSGLHYSVDGGQNWTDIPQPVDAPDDSSVVYGINQLRALPIVAVENNFTRDIAFTKNAIWITSFAGGTRKSTDNGQTWQRVVLPPDYLDEIKPTDTLNFTLSPSSGALGFEDNLNHRAFSVEAVGDSVLYVGTANGINKSVDGGISWQKFNHQNQENGISGNFIVTMSFDESRNTLWAATWKAIGETEYFALSSTPDGGENWNVFLVGERVHSIGFVYDKNGNELLSSSILSGTENGIFRTLDLGDTWIAAPPMVDEDTRNSITTKEFRAFNSQLLNDNTHYLWFGTTQGLARFHETAGVWEGEWKVYIASSSELLQEETFAFPNPFSPDDEVLKIKYSTGGNNATVTIRIFDFDMNPVRTLIQNVSRNGNLEHIEYWDGRDDTGAIVPNGVYFYRIEFDSSKPLYGKIMVMM